MRFLFAAAGVDYVQWKALARAYMWTDFATLFGAYGPVEAKRAAIALLVAWLFLTLFGLSQASIVWLAEDAFLAAALVTTTMTLWIGLMILTQSATLISPEDFTIVGFRPVTSRTYFAVKLTALLLLTLETTALMGWLPVVAFTTRDDGTPWLGLAAAASFAGASVAVAMAMVVLYGALIRKVRPARLSVFLSYAGAFATVALTAGAMLAINHFAQSDTPGAFLHRTLVRDLRTMWFPGAWFASYVVLAQGAGGTTEITAAGLSVATVVVLMLLLRGRLSRDYAATMAELTSLAGPVPSPREQRWTFLRGEARAVALLVKHHLRSDARFQLAVTMNAVMAVTITAITSEFRVPVDPFVSDGGRMDTLMLPVFALLFVPAQMYQSLVQTPAYQASWLFFTSPGSHAKLVTAGRDAVAIFVLLPAITLLGLGFGVAYHHFVHGLLHAAFLGAIAYASLQLTVLITPRLPFSTPLVQGSPHGFPLFTNLLVMLIGMPFFALLQYLSYRGGVELAAGFAAIGLLIAVLSVLTRRRIARKASTLVYIH